MKGVEEEREHVKEEHADDVLVWVGEYYSSGIDTAIKGFIMGSISRKELDSKVEVAIEESINLATEAHDESDHAHE